MIKAVQPYSISHTSSIPQQNNVTSFGAKPFRVPVTIEHTLDGFPLGKITGNFAKEYENPNAKQLYKQLKKSRGIGEKSRLREEMGDYRIVDLNAERKTKIKKFLDKILWR